MTIPAERAQEVVNRLTEAGIKGILNFTSARLNAPADVLIQNVDLTNELQTLIYIEEFPSLCYSFSVKISNKFEEEFFYDLHITRSTICI